MAGKPTTLGERVEETIRGSGLDHNEFARRADVNTSVLSRLKADSSKTAGKRSAEELAKIARTGKVDLQWLVLGEPSNGSTSVAPAPTDERYPSKRPAAKAVRGLVDDEAIEAMLSEEHYGTEKDPGPEFWMQRARWWQEERNRVRAALDGKARVDTEEPRTKPKAKRP